MKCLLCRRVSVSETCCWETKASRMMTGKCWVNSFFFQSESKRFRWWCLKQSMTKTAWTLCQLSSLTLQTNSFIIIIKKSFILFNIVVVYFPSWRHCPLTIQNYLSVDRELKKLVSRELSLVLIVILKAVWLFCFWRGNGAFWLCLCSEIRSVQRLKRLSGKSL